jgi:hypothetical protein
MSVEESIKEIQKGLTGLDNLIPPKKDELPKYHYNHFSYTLPNPTITIESKDIPFTHLDAFFAGSMIAGLICFGMALKGLGF